MNNFSERLRYLMNQQEITDHNELADRLLKGGYFEFELDTNNDSYARIKNNDKKTNIARTIKRQLEGTTEPTVKYLNYYYDFFGCSYDFLFGVIDTPLHKEDELQENLGLTKTAIRNLLESNKTKYTGFTGNNSYYITDLINTLLDYKNTKSDNDNKKQHLSTLYSLYTYLTFKPVTFVTKDFKELRNIGILDSKLNKQLPLRAYQLEDLQIMDLTTSLKSLKKQVYQFSEVPQESELNILLATKKYYEGLRTDSTITEDELKEVENHLVLLVQVLVRDYEEYLMKNDFSALDPKYHKILEELRLCCQPNKDIKTAHLI